MGGGSARACASGGLRTSQSGTEKISSNTRETLTRKCEFPRLGGCRASGNDRGSGGISASRLRSAESPLRAAIHRRTGSGEPRVFLFGWPHAASLCHASCTNAFERLGRTNNQAHSGMAIRLARTTGGPCGMDRRAGVRAGNIKRHGAGYALVVDFLAGLCGAHFFPRPPASTSAVGFAFLCELQLCHRPWIDSACFSGAFHHQRRLCRHSGRSDSRLRLHSLPTPH